MARMSRSNSYSDAHRKYVAMYKRTMNYMARHPKFANDIKKGIIKQQQSRSQQRTRNRTTARSASTQINSGNPFSTKSSQSRTTYHEPSKASKSKGKSGKPLYLKHAFVFLRKRDHKPFLSVVMAKRRDGKNPAMSSNAPYGMGYVSNYRSKFFKRTVHNQAMSMGGMNNILIASGRHPMNTAQYTKAAQAKTKSGHKAPLFTARDNIAFNAKIRPDIGKYSQKGINGHHNYIVDTRSATKSEPFNYEKFERPLEHKAYETMKSRSAQRAAQPQKQSQQQAPVQQGGNPFASGPQDDGAEL